MKSAKRAESLKVVTGISPDLCARRSAIQYGRLTHYRRGSADLRLKTGN